MHVMCNFLNVSYFCDLQLCVKFCRCSFCAELDATYVAQMYYYSNERYVWILVSDLSTPAPSSSSTWQETFHMLPYHLHTQSSLHSTFKQHLTNTLNTIRSDRLITLIITTIKHTFSVVPRLSLKGSFI